MMKSAQVIFVLWLRDMMHFIRSPGRIIGSVTLPLFLLISMGAGFGRANIPGIPTGVGYLAFLVPGMAGMTILFGGTFSGLSVLWDRQFGFLKEILVAPVPRVAIVIGRIASGSTTGVAQAIVIVLIAGIIGFHYPSVMSIAFSVVVMVLVSVTFTGLGLIFASRMKDEQGFGLIMNFLILPVLFLSGAFAPVTNLPPWVVAITYANPLTWGIDGLRYFLNGNSHLPIALDLGVSAAAAALLVLAGAWFFETSEVV